MSQQTTCPLRWTVNFHIFATTNSKPFGKRLSPCAETPNHSWNDFRRARKCQTIREMTFAERGNAKPFGKWLSPSAEIPNHSGNDFRRARKCQTIREITFAMRGNFKPFGKRLSPSAEMPNHLGNNFRHARKLQTFCVMICGRPYRRARNDWNYNRNTLVDILTPKR